MRFPALLIVIAAAMWGLDGIIFRPFLRELPVLTVVFVEHAISLLFLLPVFLFWRGDQLKKAFASLGKGGWFAWAWVIVFGGVIGTYAITQAFFLVDFSAEVPVNFSVVALLQKLQPVFALIIARVFLKEKLGNAFWGLASIAIVASFVLAFPELAYSFTQKIIHLPVSLTGKAVPVPLAWPSFPVDENSTKAALFSLLAAFSWGSATVASREIALKVKFPEATFLRFLGVVIVMFPLVLLIPGSASFGEISTSQWQIFLGIFATSGALALFLYYAGLRKTKASISTICELAFPIAALAGEYFIHGRTLGTVQFIAGMFLVYSVTRLVIYQHQKQKEQKA